MKRIEKAVIFILILCISLFMISGKIHHGKKNYWKSYSKFVDGKDKEFHYFIQKSVKDIDFENGNMKAKIERKWRKIETVNLPEGFLTWSFEKRIATIEGIKKMDMPELAGPHNAIVASHGVTRKDSMYSINNAVKILLWCLEWESNPHSRRNKILSLACLPIPPSRHVSQIILVKFGSKDKFFLKNSV